MQTTTVSKNLKTAGLALLLCQVLSAQPAQPPTPAKIGLTFSTESTSSGPTRLRAGDTSYKHVEINNNAWTLAQSIGLDATSSLAVNLAYSRTGISEGNYHNFDRDYSADRVPLPNDLQSLGASIEYSTKIDNQWSLSTSIGAGSHVDKHNLLSKGWGAEGHVMGLYNWSPALTFAAGLAYDSLSADWKIMPIFGFEWRPADKWSVAIGFPKTAVSYEFNQRFTLALAASGAGGTYFIGDDPRPGTAPRSLANSKLEYTEARLGFEAAWKINDTFRLSGTVGHVLYRKFKYIDRDFELKSRDVVPFVSVAFSAAF